ncbi:MAG: LacI family DNA-binding transcriptional regulator [Coriobacteriaceae bacterium]|nr:LacI family DNA-binding transcriptional regulator [Coriobacteriaceae bacterium]
MADRVTIQDIADELGLSRNTVSKALNGADGLAEATRERIINKAMEMGYKQFIYTRLVTQYKDDTQGIIPSLGDRREVAVLSTAYLAAPHFSSLMLDGFQNELSQTGFTLNTHRVSQANIESLELPATLDLSRVAAIVCIEMFDWRYDEMICALDVPVLFVDGPARLHGENLPCDQLYMENTTQVMRLVNDMLAKGYRRIGFVGNWEHCQSFFERYCAFRNAMALADVPVEDRFIIKYNSVREMRHALRDLDELPDLFICANDFVALDLLMLLHGMGVDVPRDVMLAGFDDSAESRRSMPQLTTIHIHTQVMAFSAIQTLRTRIKEPSLDFRQVYTETELIYRASTKRE